MPSILQDWVQELPFMQQTILLTAIHAPDGNVKYDPPKMLLHWYHRCVLISALDGVVLNTPRDSRGGSFTGPSFENGNKLDIFQKADDYAMSCHLADYILSLDAIPAHFQRHFMHAIQILGYKHPVPGVRVSWFKMYERLVNEMHLNPESEEAMDLRLSDNLEAWLKRSDAATQK